jgi:tetratricopeptide (TPR) repeat protein
MLLRLGGRAQRHRQRDQADEYFQESLAIARRIEDWGNAARALLRLGAVAEQNEEIYRAQRCYQEAFAIALGNGDWERITAARGSEWTRAYYEEARMIDYDVKCLNGIQGILIAWYPVCAKQLEELAEFDSTWEDELNRFRNWLPPLEWRQSHRGPSRRLIPLRSMEAQLAPLRGESERAEEYCQEGLDVARKIGDRWFIIDLLNTQGEIHLKRQKLEAASEAFREALEEAQEAGINDAVLPETWHEVLASYAMYGLARVAAVQGDIEEAVRQGRESLVILETTEHYKAYEVREWLATLSPVDVSN